MAGPWRMGLMSQCKRAPCPCPHVKSQKEGALYEARGPLDLPCLGLGLPFFFISHPPTGILLQQPRRIKVALTQLSCFSSWHGTWEKGHVIRKVGSPESVYNFQGIPLSKPGVVVRLKMSLRERHPLHCLWDCTVVQECRLVQSVWKFPKKLGLGSH